MMCSAVRPPLPDRPPLVLCDREYGHSGRHSHEQRPADWQAYRRTIVRTWANQADPGPDYPEGPYLEAVPDGPT